MTGYRAYSIGENIDPQLEIRIKRWMENCYHDYDTATALVEAAANAFIIDDWLDDDTHPIWDWALDVSNWD